MDHNARGLGANHYHFHPCLFIFAHFLVSIWHNLHFALSRILEWSLEQLYYTILALEIFHLLWVPLLRVFLKSILPNEALVRELCRLLARELLISDLFLCFVINLLIIIHHHFCLQFYHQDQVYLQEYQGKSKND